MKKKTQEENGKRRRGKTNYSQWFRLFKRLAIVGALLLTIFFGWKYWDKIAPAALLDWTESTFGDAQKGEGFPTGIAGNSVIYMAETKQHLAVLTDTSLRFYSANAACVVERSHAFTKPMLHAAGKYVLITEHGGDRIRLDTRRETVLDTTLENSEIYASALLPNGTIAVVLNNTSKSYVSELRVLSSSGEETFVYKSNKYLLTSVALSPNGKEVVAVGTGAENGVLKSVLLVIPVSKGEVKEYSGTDVLLHTVSYTSKGAVLAIGDREVWALAPHADAPQKLSCEGLEPVGYSASDNTLGIALRRVGSTDKGALWLFDAAGNRVQETEYNGVYRSISTNGNRVLLLTDRLLYEAQNTEVQTVEVPTDSLQAVTFRRSSLVLTLTQLMRTEKQ